MTLFKRSYIASLLLLAGCLTLTACQPDTIPRPEQRNWPLTAQKPVVLGFYTQYDKSDEESLNSLKQYGNDISMVATMTYRLGTNSPIDGTPPTQALKFGKSENHPIFAGITNIQGSSFNERTLHRILESPTLVTREVQALTSLVENVGFAGITVDFENVQPADRGLLSNFIRKLSIQLHSSHKQLCMSVPAKTSDSPRDAWSGAYDYRVLGSYVDYLQLMTYDEFGPWSSPGPVASLPWVESVIDYAKTEVPPRKILMGIASYGYDWDTKKRSLNRAWSWKQIGNILRDTNAQVKWSSDDLSPHFTYTDKSKRTHVVWFENQRSIEDKLSLAEQNGLHGVAVWRLGLEDSSFWNALESGVKS